MTEALNLKSQIKKQLPAELVDFMQRAGEVAARQGQNLYLVGGVVRDLLLGRSNLDLDLVVEDDAIRLARQLVDIKQGKLTVHPRFNTAKIRWRDGSIDLATVRSETYARPGALPKVAPGSLRGDLFRRDFTINAMAVKLTSDNYGELIDFYGGRRDLEGGYIRILHEKSFTDDATRIWRALRYEQRLDFRLEEVTLRLLQRDIPMLDTISGNRLYHELELVLKEEHPEKALCRADEIKVLPKVHSSLRGDDWLAARFTRVRELTSPAPPSVELYMALLAYRLTDGEIEQLISYLRLPKATGQTLRDAVGIKAKIESLSVSGLAPSSIYSLLHGYSSPALMANLVASDSEVAGEHIQLFLNKLRYVKPALTGDDLGKLGISPGPRIKEILERLRRARLDGEVSSKKDEEGLVRGWVEI